MRLEGKIASHLLDHLPIHPGTRSPPQSPYRTSYRPCRHRRCRHITGIAMNPKTRFALIALLALLAVVAGFIAAGYKYRQQFVVPGISLSESTRASEQLLALTLADASAVSQPLSQWRGKLLVVNFWATWCPPCREEMPGFSRLNTKFTSKSVQFVGIAIDHADKVRNIRFKHLLHTRSGWKPRAHAYRVVGQYLVACLYRDHRP